MFRAIDSSSLTRGFGAENRRLVRNLVMVTAVTLVLCFAALIYFDQRLVKLLSHQLIEKSSRVISLELDSHFTPLEQGLIVAQDQLEGVDLFGGDAARAFYDIMEPFLQHYPEVSAVVAANSAGSSHFLIGDGDNSYLSREIDARENPRLGQWRRWQNGEANETWSRQVDFDPRIRSWYKNVTDAEPGTLAYTEPYMFFTAKKPGISISRKWRHGETDEHYVAAFDVTLEDFSRVTTSLRPSEHGFAIVVTDDAKLLGLPPRDDYARSEARAAAVLASVTKLGIPAVDDAFAEWEQRGRTAGIFRYRSQGQAWWVGFEPYEYLPGRRYWTSVLIPESDFLAGITRQRGLVIAAIAGSGILLALIIVVSAARSMRRELRNQVSRIERKLGQYRLEHRIGEGGNGAVYRARHAFLRRPTAVKLMHPEFARTDQAKARFEHEVQAMSSLTHPNTVSVYDYGQTPDGTLYYAMEYLPGLTLDRLVQAGPVPASRVIHILRQVCGSLGEAHDKGLVHRDIKSANIMLCERGGVLDVVKVLDFGLVKELQHTDAELTQAGTLVGTPLFMAPELIEAPDRASPRSDVYAVGAVAYQLLAGRHVFEGASAVEICAAHLQQQPVPPSQRTDQPIPPDLEAVILACLAKQPENRPADAKALETRLAACTDAGHWSAEDARNWLQQYQHELPLDDTHQTRAPLSNTELLVDVSDRLKSVSTATEVPPGQ